MLTVETAANTGGVQSPPAGYFGRGLRSVSIVDDMYYGWPSKLLQCADARLGWVQQNPSPGIQAYGSIGTVGTSVTADVTGTSVDGSTMRFGAVADPDDAGKVCWHIRVHPDDPLTASSKRGEFAHTSSRVRHWNERTVGLCVRLQDWTELTDQQLFWQWHTDDALSAAPSPWLAGYVLDGEMVVQMRYDTRETPVSQTIVELYRDAAWTPLSWERWVIRSRAGYNGTGFVQILRDGQLIVDYSGAVGSNEQGVGTETSYFKNGYYHWINAGNDWDTSVNTREVWHKGAYIADGRVSVSEMDDFLASI